MAKIRRVDWSPDEYIAGTFGLLSVEEHGVYNIALNLIYSRGGRTANDLSQFTGACKGTHWRTVKTALAGLIEKGKLIVSEDGLWLSNSRADRELSKARARVEQANDAANEAGKTHSRRAQERSKTASRRSQDHPKNAPSRSHADAKLSDFNGLTEPDGYFRGEPNHQPSTTNVDSGESLTGCERGTHTQRKVAPTQIPPEFAEEIRNRPRARPIPDDWGPISDDIAWARKARPDLDDAALKDQTERLILKAKAGNWVQFDWSMKWRAWIKDAHLGKDSNGTQRSSTPRRQSGNSRLNNFYAGWSGQDDSGPTTTAGPRGQPGPELVGAASLVDPDGPTETGEDSDGPDAHTGR